MRPGDASNRPLAVDGLSCVSSHDPKRAGVEVADIINVENLISQSDITIVT